MKENGAKDLVSFPANPYRAAMKRGLFCAGLLFCAAVVLAVGSNKEIWGYAWFSVEVSSDGKALPPKGVLWVVLSGLAGFFSLFCLAAVYWVRIKAKALERLVEDLKGKELIARFSIKGEDWFENNKQITARYVLILWAVLLGIFCLFVGLFVLERWGENRPIFAGQVLVEQLPILAALVAAGILGTLYFLYPLYRLSRRAHGVILYPGVMLLGDRWVIWCMREAFQMELVEVVPIQKENPQRYAIRFTLEPRRSRGTRYVWEDRVHYCIPIPEEQRADLERLRKMFRAGKL